MTKTEEIIVGLISSAGQSKSLAFEALKKARTGDYDEARELLRLIGMPFKGMNKQ